MIASIASKSALLGYTAEIHLESIQVIFTNSGGHQITCVPEDSRLTVAHVTVYDPVSFEPDGFVVVRASVPIRLRIPRVSALHGYTYAYLTPDHVLDLFYDGRKPQVHKVESTL